MVKLDNVTEGVLDVINDNKFSQTGAFNLRENGTSICHGDSEHIKIKKKTDKPGIDIYIDGKTDGEAVYIPVVLSKSGMTDLVYNDFYVEDGADVRIVAGCGIHNSGCNESRHDGIHTFHVGKNANVRYEEKHYGEGNGTGARVLNPVTNIFVGENSVFTLDTAQIKGVDSTVRETNVELGKDAKLYVTERLMTDGEQKAESNIEVQLNGEDSSAQIVSRSVGKGNSVQTFHPNAIGNSKCQAHIQCDSIIMDHAEVGSIPEIRAKNIDAAIIHEAAIGRINDEQLLKLRTLGLTEEEAEEVSSWENRIPWENNNYTQLLSAGRKEGGLILKELHPVSGRQFRIDKTHPTIIGQLKDQADLVLPSTAVSRVHASIEQRAGSWYLKDLNSRNGTWVNDQELYGEEEKELATGDQIQFADLVYRVEI